MFDQQVSLDSNGGAIYWSPQSFGSNQEAYVTFTQVDSTTNDIELLLKVQGVWWGDGLIEVWHDPSAQRIEVWTFTVQ